MAGDQRANTPPAASSTNTGSPGIKPAVIKGKSRISALAARFEQGGKAKPGEQLEPRTSAAKRLPPASSAPAKEPFLDAPTGDIPNTLPAGEPRQEAEVVDSKAGSPTLPTGLPGSGFAASALSAEHGHSTGAYEQDAAAGGCDPATAAQGSEGRAIQHTSLQNTTQTSIANAERRGRVGGVHSKDSGAPTAEALHTGSEEPLREGVEPAVAGCDGESSKVGAKARSSSATEAAADRGMTHGAVPISASSSKADDGQETTASANIPAEEQHAAQASWRRRGAYLTGRGDERGGVTGEFQTPADASQAGLARAFYSSDASNPFGAPQDDDSDSPSNAAVSAARDDGAAGVIDGDTNNPFEAQPADVSGPSAERGSGGDDDGGTLYRAPPGGVLDPPSNLVLPTHTTSAAVKIAGRPYDVFEVRGSDREPEVSPFGGAESYTLSPSEDFQMSPPHGALSSPLGTVPEDGPPPSDDLLESQTSTSPVVIPSSAVLGPKPEVDVIKPDSLKLAKVKAPRVKPLGAEDTKEASQEPRYGSTDSSRSAAAASRHRSSEDSDQGEHMRINVLQQQSEAGMDVLVFNPFAGPRDGGVFPEAMSPAVDDGVFNMEFDQPAHESAAVELHNLDFGSSGRRGSGVIGPRLDVYDSGRIADKFEVQEGEDMEIKQIMWVAENLQEELAIANAAFESVDALVAERRAEVDALNTAWEASTNELEEIEEELASLHSRLEQQLLTKLEQEDEIRETVEKLKAVRAETAALDRELQEKEEKRRELQRQVAQKKAAPEGRAGDEEAKEGGSPDSHMSSPWATSDDSDNERLDLTALPVQRPSASTLSEDNQAKMKEKGGALGGSWLRSVLGGRRSSKELRVPPPARSDTSPGKVRVMGGGQSHTEQPTTAAELMPIPLELEPEPAR